MIKSLHPRLVILLAAFAPAYASAQVAPKPVAGTDEALTLSPFTVTVEKEAGYQATSTLAGTRINTPLKDIGASLSVYTKDFINDIGAASANDLLVYAVGMEAAGSGGNYSAATSDIASAQVTGDNARVNPQQARTRGLAGPTFTRGFFTSGITIDSYNTGAVTVMRGPNAILFGTGSAGGVVDSAINTADVRRNTNRLEFRYGNNDSTRSVFDFNRVLLPGKLAFRLSALQDNEEFNQRPAFDHKKRIFGTVTAKPTKSTTLRASFESGGSSANRPINVLPFNSISSQWYEQGRPTYDWRLYDYPELNPNAATQVAGSGVASTANTIGQGQFFNQIGIFYNQPNAQTPSYSQRSRLVNTDNFAADSLRNSLFDPVVNRDFRVDTIQMVTTLANGELGGSAFPGGVVPAGLKFQGFTNYSAFDFKNKMLDETSRQMDAFRTFNLTFEQLAWKDRIGFEVAFRRERVDVRGRNSFIQAPNSNHVRVDTTVTLPNGEPNPNVGRPFVQYGGGGWQNTFTERQSGRATAFLRYDFKDLGPKWTQWLGRHVVTGLREENRTDTLSYNSWLATFGDAATAINPVANQFARRPGLFVYIGDSILDGRPLKLEAVRVPLVRDGLSAQTTYFKAPAGSTSQGSFVTTTTTLKEITNDGSITRNTNKAKAAVLQSYWLRELLVTTVGWRRDAEYRKSTQFFYQNESSKVQYGFADFILPELPDQLAARETTSYSAVLRWPHKLFRLPAGADLSVFVNSSDNFAPSGGRINAYGETLPQQTGKTKEYGLNLSFLGDRFQLRINRFETAAVNQSINSAAYSTAYNNNILQTATFWDVERNTNPAIDRSADVELLFSTLPKNFRQLHRYTLTGSAQQQNLAASYTIAPNISDTTDFTAKGTEFEATFNPSRQWRFLFNVANQETVQTNIAPATRELFARMKPVWDALANRPRLNYPTGFALGDPLPSNVTTVAQQLVGALSQYETLIATEGSASPEQRKWRANVVASHTFGKETFLRGWNVGTGIRWQDKIGIGYPASRNAAGAVKIDIARPYFSPGETNVDAFVGYTRKLWKDRIEWKIQLNVRNLIGQGDPIAITAQPTGEAAIVRLPPEKRWYITNTLSF